MPVESTSKKQPSNRKLLVKKHFSTIIKWSIIIYILGSIVYYFHNFAEDAAQPIEHQLILGGAIKMCGDGDPGHGPDNLIPHYNANFMFNGTKERALELIQAISAYNGFSLTKLSSDDPETTWLEDSPGKQECFFTLGNRTVAISFSLYNGKTLACNQQDLSSDKNHTAIAFGLGISDVQ